MLRHSSSLYIRIICMMTAVFSGVCLFVILFSATGMTFLNPGFHKQLFSKYGIYSKAYDIINSSFNDSITATVESSLTADNVRVSVDTVLEGVLKYIRGESEFLPDISLNTDSMENAVINPSDPYTLTLAYIPKINLNAILLYFNRTDVISALKLLKFIYSVLKDIPVILSAVIFLSLLTTGKISAGAVKVGKWSRTVIISGSSISLISGLLLLAAGRKAVDSIISISSQYKIVSNYMLACLSHMSVYLIITGAILMFLSAGQLLISSLISRKVSSGRPVRPHRLKLFSVDNEKFRSVFNAVVYLLLPVVLISAASYSLQKISREYSKNDFSAVFSKIIPPNTSLKVIQASDETMYTLKTTVVNEKDGSPVANVKLDIEGKSESANGTVKKTVITDSEGIAKTSLTKGTFILSPEPDSLPSGYQTPLPLSVELKASGVNEVIIELKPLDDQLN